VNGYLRLWLTCCQLLLLEALFMQISGVCLTLIWPHRLCLHRVLLGMSHCYKQWIFPPLLWSFLPTTTFRSFPAPGCWVCAATPAFSSQLVVRDFPSPALWCLGCPALFGTSLFCCFCSFFFLFFP
jgi:hypothetical protein